MLRLDCKLSTKNVIRIQRILLALLLIGMFAVRRILSSIPLGVNCKLYSVITAQTSLLISTSVRFPHFYAFRLTSCPNLPTHSKTTGPSCSKLTTSLVNDSLKFTSSDTQIC